MIECARMPYNHLRDEVSILDEVLVDTHQDVNHPTNILIALIRHPDLFRYFSFPSLMEGLPADDQAEILFEAEELASRIRDDVHREMAKQGFTDLVTDNDFRLAEDFMRRLPRG